jgi:hypothetical protein
MIVWYCFEIWKDIYMTICWDATHFTSDLSWILLCNLQVKTLLGLEAGQFWRVLTISLLYENHCAGQGI